MVSLKAKRLLGNLGIIGVGRLSGQIVAIALLPVYTAALSPRDFGVVDLAITYVALLSPLLTLQLETAVFRFLIDVRGDDAGTRRVTSTAIISVCILLTAVGIAALVAAIFSDFAYLPHFAILLISSGLYGVFLQVARGMGRTITYSIASIVVALWTLTATLVTIQLGVFDVYRFLEINASACFLGLVYLMIATRCHRYFSFRAIDRALLRRMLKYSLPLVPNAIAWWAINAAGRTIVALAIGLPAAGIFAVASRFPAILGGLTGIFSLAWTESAATSIADDDRGPFFSRIANNSLLLFAGIVIALLAVLPALFPIFIADEFSEAYMYVPILLVGSLAHSMVTFYSGVLIAQAKTGKVANTSIGAAVISVGIAVGTVNWLGIMGVALGAAVAFTSMAVYRHLTLRKEIGVRLSLKSIFAVIAALSVSMTLYYVEIPAWIPAAIGGVLSLALLVAPLIALRSSRRPRVAAPVE